MSWFHRKQSASKKSRRQASNRRDCKVNPQFESLEQRTLMHANPLSCGVEMGISPYIPNPRATAAAAATAQAPSYPLADTFRLHSLSGATKRILLDFDGHTTPAGTWWNNGASIVSAPYNFDGVAGFSNIELEEIQHIWERVSEDFRPFNVDVTTEDPGQEALINRGGTDTQWGMRIVLSPTSSWYPGVGGVAYLNSFGNLSTGPTAFVFNSGETNAAEAASHEAGHTLGLNHDGTTTGYEYYSGHGSGATSWGPIMGVGYYTQLTQWSKGQYANANNSEDDLSIITTRNGFGYRSDDTSNSTVGATPVTVDANGLSAKGIIERNNDLDVFTFTSPGGLANLTVSPFERGPNLDIRADLLDSNGNVIATSNPSNTLDAQLTANIGSGTYFVRVDGVGKGNPLSDGYSDYGSLGAYSIRGSVSIPLDVFEPNDTMATARNLGVVGSWYAGNLSIHAAGNEDWFRLIAPANGQIDVYASFSHALGDVDLAVFAKDGTALGYSAGVTDSEEVHITGKIGETYYIRVIGYNGATNPNYEIDIDGQSGDEFYYTTQSGGTVTNSDGTKLTFADSDIVRLLVGMNGEFRHQMYFDASDVGLSGDNEDLDGFSMLPDGRIVVSTFASSSVSSTYVNGSGSGSTISGAGEDLLVFTPTELGDNTSGTWAMFFDGSDVGLSGSNENVDSVAVLPNGKILVSVTNTFTAGAVSGGLDEDLFEFTPAANSTGTNTVGTWAWYLDGSDVKLDNSDEDVDALFVDSSSGVTTLYMSTAGNMSATGISAGDEDVFVYTPTQTGANSAGTFRSTLGLDGSRVGLGSFDIDGIHVGSVPNQQLVRSAAPPASAQSSSSAVASSTTPIVQPTTVAVNNVATQPSAKTVQPSRVAATQNVATWQQAADSALTSLYANTANASKTPVRRNENVTPAAVDELMASLHAL